MKYFGSWSSYEDMEKAFKGYDATYELPEDFPRPHEVLFAGYFDGSYSGYANIIYRKRGRLYENAVSHCSCNGLSGEWGKGGEVTPESLAMRGELPDYYDVDEDARAAWSRLVKRLNRKTEA